MHIIKPIPKKLLIHTVIYGKEEENDRWGSGTFKEKQTIKHIRIEPSSKIIRDKNNAEIQLAATVFYDCRNSLPRGMVFSLDDIIIFNGQKYQVKDIEPLYDRKKLHHYELGVIKHA